MFFEGVRNQKEGGRIVKERIQISYIRASYVPKRTDDAVVRGPIFLILSWGRSDWGVAGTIFVNLQFSSSCLAYYQPYDSSYWSKSSELVS